MVKRKIILVKIVVVLNILALPVFAKKTSITQEGKHKMTQSIIINGKRYANWQNSSFLPVSGNLKGNELWNSSPAKQYSDDSPYLLCLGNSTLISAYIKGINARNSHTGDLNWAKEFINLCDFVLDTEGIWVASPGDAFYKISLQNIKINEVKIVLFSDYPKLLYLQPDKDNYLYVYNRYPSSFDKPELDDGFTITNLNVNQRKIDYEYYTKTIATWFTLSNDNKNCYIATAYLLYSFPLSIKSDKDINKIDFPFIISISVYSDGNLIVCQDTDKNKKIPTPQNKRILSLSPQGKINWEVPINEFSKSGQPPAFAPGGNIYYCAGNTLLCIKEGKIEWEYELTTGITEIYLTVLKDQSVLVAALNMLSYISSDGKLIKSVVNPFVITCRPIMDTEGKIYIAGKQGIRCLE